MGELGAGLELAAGCCWDVGRGRGRFAGCKTGGRFQGFDFDLDLDITGAKADS